MALTISRNNISSSRCIICLDNKPKNPVKSKQCKCQSIYCKKCFVGWLNMQRVCPTCRHTYISETDFTNYDRLNKLAFITVMFSVVLVQFEKVNTHFPTILVFHASGLAAGCFILVTNCCYKIVKDILEYTQYYENIN
jgi:hypothetical protein